MTVPICGVVLAGGQASRMGGGDKTLLHVGGKPILARALSCLEPYCAPLALSANGDAARFSAFNLTVVADSVEDSAGPLAGILAAMDWSAANARQAEWLAAIPGDCPFLPKDLVPRLLKAAGEQNKQIACAKSGEWRHPLAAVWRISLRHDLRRAFIGDGVRKVEIWAARHGIAHAEWPDKPVDLFLNVNTPDDLHAAERIAAENPAL